MAVAPKGLPHAGEVQELIRGVVENQHIVGDIHVAVVVYPLRADPLPVQLEGGGRGAVRRCGHRSSNTSCMS